MLNSIVKIKKKNITHNLTLASDTTFYYPKNYDDLKKLLIYLKNIKKKVLIKSGGCGYGDKSNLQKSEYAISLSKLNKIIKFDKKRKTVTAQAGISIYELFFYLKEKEHIIFNVPGGKSVSLGGGISGNVHGRPSKKNYANFGDNIISLKVMFENGKIKLITKKNKIFRNIIGSLGVYVIILEAKLRIHKISNLFVEKASRTVASESEFKSYEKNLATCYGYINHFNADTFEGSFVHFVPKANVKKEKVVQLKSYSLLKLSNFFKIPFVISFFVNPYTLKIIYDMLFYLKKNFTIFNKSEIFTLERSMYFDLIQVLPNFHRGGLIEIQFDVQRNKLFNLITALKKIFFHFNVFPSAFVLKKAITSKKNYIFNFPKNNFSITLTFSKKDYNNNKIFFKNFYQLLFKNKCNQYLTKNETFLDNIHSQNKKKYFNLNLFIKSKILSSDFKEKILSLIS